MLWNNRVRDISSFGCGGLFIVRFYGGQTKRAHNLDNPREHAIVKRLISMGKFKVVIAIGGYELYERPQRNWRDKIVWG